MWPGIENQEYRDGGKWNKKSRLQDDVYFNLKTLLLMLALKDFAHCVRIPTDDDDDGDDLTKTLNDNRI